MPPDAAAPHVLFVTGEASGDLHAAAMTRELRVILPSIRVSAVGGTQLEAAGAQLIARIEHTTAFGLTEPLMRIKDLVQTMRAILKCVDTDKPEAVILVDFTEFNMLLARFLKRRNVAVIWYISPQIWAWRGGRARTLARLVDRMICFFPWEKPLYDAVGLDCVWVGHPLVESVRPTQSRARTREEFGIASDKRVIALLPGSRPFEIENFIPRYCAAAKLLLDRRPDLQFWLPVASTLTEEDVRAHIPADAPPITLVHGRTYDVLNASDFAVVASGTATLETALLECPMLIVMMVSPMTYRVGMTFFASVPYYGLINHLAGRQIVPELVQEDVTPEGIAGIVESFLDSAELRDIMVNDIRQATATLGEPGAAARAAEAVAEILTTAAKRECAA